MENRDQTDVAALGSGVVGVAVTMLMEDGPFHPTGAMVCVTLMLVILSYIGGHERGWFKRTAFGAVMGVLALPIVGVLLEADFDAKESSVGWLTMVATWAIAGVVMWVGDYGAMWFRRWRES